MGEGGGGNLFMIDIEEDQEEDKRYSKIINSPTKKKIIVAGTGKTFTLPYRSRCTKVIVAVVNDVIGHTKANGNLTDRVNKNLLSAR